MKSKNFSSNKMADDMKKQLWLLSLAALVMFIAYPVACLLLTGQPQYLDPLSYAELEVRFRDIIGFTHGIILNIGAALLIGVVEFSYLHSRQKSDFYHSLPIKRRKLFFRKLAAGFLCYALPYFAAVLLTLCVGAARGIFSAALVGISLLSYLVNLLVFLLNYLTVILAMLLTGRLLTGILGSMVFMVYGPVLSVILSSYGEMHFATYAGGGKLFDFFQMLSPCTWGSRVLLSMDKATGGRTKVNMLTALFQRDTNILSALLVTLLVTAGLFALSMWVYQKRPSEAAENPMAFRKPAAAIKFCIVIPAALAVGAFFQGMAPSYEGMWNIFGMLLGLLVFYGIIETIYGMDFKKFFSHKLQLVLAAAGVCAVFLIFRLDVFGYDSFLPPLEKLESVGITVDGLGSMGYVGPEAEVPADKEVYQILEKITANAIDTSEDKESTYETSGQLTGITVSYQQKAGAEYAVSRHYTVDIDKIRDDLGKLFDYESFKEAVFSLSTLEPVFEGNLVFTYPGGEYTMANLKQEDKERLLEAYQKDVREMDSHDLDSAPVGGLTVDYGDSRNGLVMSKFTRTIKILTELGAKPWTDPDAKDVESITIESMEDMESVKRSPASAAEESDGGRGIIIKDKQAIKALLPYMAPSGFWLFWQEVEKGGSGTITFKDSKGEDSAISCNLLKGFSKKIAKITVK